MRTLKKLRIRKKSKIIDSQSGEEKWTSKQYHDAMQDIINRERKNLKTRLHCEG